MEKIETRFQYAFRIKYKVSHSRSTGSLVGPRLRLVRTLKVVAGPPPRSLDDEEHADGSEARVAAAHWARIMEPAAMIRADGDRGRPLTDAF